MRTEGDTFSVLPGTPGSIVAALLATDKRILLVGDVGSGKSTLAAGLANSLREAGRHCWCIGADPGSPAFGVPGAVCLAGWRGGAWQVTAVEALCSLDAGRFRLPLVQAVTRLLQGLPGGAVLIDSPGVVRGIAGAELLAGLTQASNPDAVLVLAREGQDPPLERELRALGKDVRLAMARPEARRPGKPARARQRTRLWDVYLRDAEDRNLDLQQLHVIGAPPPLDVPAAWCGRQCALVDGQRTLVLGEVVNLDGKLLRVRMPRTRNNAHALLLRDARRSVAMMLETAKPFAAAEVHYVPATDIRPYAVPGNAGGPRPVASIGAATAILVNGVFGDPLLHIRLRHQKRSLLFDLGEPGRLPARIAHQVSDVFISHAHMDHIGGFLWLLRSRIGLLPPCRLYGPPGLADNIAGMMRGVLWDRIGDRGPRFEVTELGGERLARFCIQAGRSACEPVDEVAAVDGVVLDEPAFRVYAATLDHGTPVLAFAFEPALQINIRKERLVARGLSVGPWLSLLKQRILAGDRDTPIVLPDGSEQASGALADDLSLIRPGDRLVYATDLADTADNRRRLATFARRAHTFFCEATFSEADSGQARRTGHLTARACGEIATAADVQRLIPFHFSRRYEKAPEILYQELTAACSRVVLPAGARGSVS